MNTNEKILKLAKTYFEESDLNDFSHSFSHVERVKCLALFIGEKEGADLEVLEASALLHDIARGKEDRGEVEDHAVEGANMAELILNEVGFPSEKIANVVHTIKTHRCNPAYVAETLEAKILQDADRLDALGAVDISRVIASKLQSEAYKGPIYTKKPYRGPGDKDTSAIHYLIFKTRDAKRLPVNFNTDTGKKIAQKRFRYMKNFIKRFMKEWNGKP